jgi:DNA-binding MarR family transcriptional regulator
MPKTREVTLADVITDVVSMPLSHLEYRVFMYLASRAILEQSATVQVSLSDIARACYMHERTARVALKSLRKASLVERKYVAGSPVFYRVLFNEITPLYRHG